MLTLIIDADDTLWENNIFYEECLVEFADLIAEQGFDAEEAEATMTVVEKERIPEVGYAPEEFARSLVVTYERVCERHQAAVRDDVARAVLEIGRKVQAYPIVPLDGVEETLEKLCGSYRLLLLTKGDRDVQEDKLERSGLGRFFDAVHVPPEKDVDVFRDLIEMYDLHPEQTWMVGNSPRSDINPAVEAGIGGIYVPHPNTWGLELEEVVASERVTVVREFRELGSLFAAREGDDQG